MLFLGCSDAAWQCYPGKKYPRRLLRRGEAREKNSFWRKRVCSLALPSGERYPRRLSRHPGSGRKECFFSDARMRLGAALRSEIPPETPPAPWLWQKRMLFLGCSDAAWQCYPGKKYPRRLLRRGEAREKNSFWRKRVC